MYNPAVKELADAVMTTGRTFTASAVFSDFTITEIGDLKINLGTSKDSHPCFGSVISAQGESKIITDETITKGMQFSLYFNIFDYNIPFGVYKIVSCKKYSDYTQIEFSDLLANCDREYISSKSGWIRATELIDEIADRIGADTPIWEEFYLCDSNGDRLISSDDSYLTATEIDFDVNINYLSGMTMREILSQIAAYFGKFLVIGRYGEIELKWYDGYEINVDDEDRFLDEIEKSDWDTRIPGIKCTINDDEVLAAGGDNDDTMEIECRFMTPERFQDLYSKAVNTNYRSANFKQVLGDPRIDPWDTFFSGTGSSKQIFYIINATFTFDGGLMLEVEGMEE